MHFVVLLTFTNGLNHSTFSCWQYHDSDIQYIRNNFLLLCLLDRFKHLEKSICIWMNKVLRSLQRSLQSFQIIQSYYSTCRFCLFEIIQIKWNYCHTTTRVNLIILVAKIDNKFIYRESVLTWSETWNKVIANLFNPVIHKPKYNWYKRYLFANIITTNYFVTNLFCVILLLFMFS